MNDDIDVLETRQFGYYRKIKQVQIKRVKYGKVQAERICLLHDLRHSTLSRPQKHSRFCAECAQALLTRAKVGCIDVANGEFGEGTTT